jgi:hypothetical protein
MIIKILISQEEERSLWAEHSRNTPLVSFFLDLPLSAPK